MSSVFEVQGENPQECKAPCESVPEVSDLVEVSNNRLHLSKTEKDNTFSICCWLQDPSEPSADLKLILGQIELQLLGCGFGLRLYFAPNLHVPLETLSGLFKDAFKELDQMNGSAKVGRKPTFNLIPVLGAGKSAAFTEDIITCELFARKS
ncbi:hypothetical protein CRYUN_Cryun08bG0032200 [Craigia yunnanensis]